MSQTLDNLSYTWNNAGTTFTGIKYNVTDTASAAGSLLMDLQVGGSSRFKVSKLGAVTTTGSYAASAADTGGYAYSSTATNAFRSDSSGFAVVASGPVLGATKPISWGSNNWYDTIDVTIYRDAANTLAQRNSTNAQTNRLYGTYTDGSNYRRLTQTMSTGGVAEIKPEGAGTGASGNVLHISGLPTSNPGAGILWNDAGTVKVGT